MNTKILFLSFVLTLLAMDSHAESGFEPAKLLEAVTPNYPESQRLAQNTGMVDLRLIVDEKGAVIHSMVMSSNMDVFEQEAQVAAAQTRYTPARLEGEAVQSMVQSRMYFPAKDAQQKMHVDFAKLHRDATRELDRKQPKASKLAKKLEKLERFNMRSPYVNTHLNLLKFRIAKKFGDLVEQINTIEKILLFEGRGGEQGDYVDQATLVALKRELFGAYVNSKRYAEGVAIYKQLKKIDPDAEASFGTTAKQLLALKYAKNPVNLDLQIEPRGYTSIELFKRTFALKNIAGRLLSLNVLCDRKFSSLTPKIETEYSIPSTWGNCYVQLVGDPETKVQLTQY